MNTRQIPILRVPFDADDHRFVQEKWAEVLRGGNLTMGKNTEEFEKRFAEFSGARFAAADSSFSPTIVTRVILR